MTSCKLNYGKTEFEVDIEDKNLIQIVESNSYIVNKTEDEIILDALHNPIGSKRLKDLVKPLETVCIVIPDSTRAWQKSHVYLWRVVEELTKAGIEDKDITIISATGTHRKQTDEEHKMLIGTDLHKRFKVLDHNCFDKANLTFLGETSQGTPVWVNKKALEADHIVITGAIVYHFLVGWSGGKKSILPGISGYETIMANHGLSLGKNIGDGTNPFIRSGNIINNPIHKDMVEAANLVKPIFMFNVIMGADGNITGAVAGDFIEAHASGRALVDKIDGVEIKEKADLVIASAGGYPKDINLYQSIKTIINAREAALEGGTIILLSECSEGFGEIQDIKDIIINFDTLIDREKELRSNYTISKFVGYYVCETADKFDLILVSNIDASLVKKANIKVVKTLEEALNLTYEKRGKNLKTILMPHGANTLPKL